MFVKATKAEPTTSIVAAIEIERPSQTDMEDEIRPTTTSFIVPEAVPTLSPMPSMVYMSVESIQALVWRQVHTES